jgi:hypothetical protein
MALHVMSLGAGVQSSTMALMAAAGEIGPMPAAAIFADTQAEPAGVYHWLDWLEKQLPFPVHRVTRGSLEKEAVVMRVSKKGSKYSRTDIPFFTLSANGEKAKIPNRSCTADYKIKPIMAACRHLLGPALRSWRKEHRAALVELNKYKDEALRRKKKNLPLPMYPKEAWKECQESAPLIQWIGISTDEMKRMKVSRDPWAQSRWPLIEKRMSRNACLDWMQRRGFPQPPRSACVFCPFHNNAEWRRLQLEEPEEFQRAVKFEADVQAAKSRSDNMDATPFLHRSCKPLDTIDFRGDVERGQGTLWDDECEGMCGV